MTVNTVGAASNGSIILEFQGEDDEHEILITRLYLGKTSVTYCTTNPVKTALGSNTGFRGTEHRLSTTSMTRTYVLESVFVRGFRKIEKSDYSLRHVYPSVCPHEITRFPLDGFS